MSVNNVSNRSTTATSSLAPSQSQTSESSAAAANQATATPAVADGLESKPVYPNLSTEASAFKLSPEGEKKASAALDKFNDRLETVLNRGHSSRAMALAEGASGGKGPYQPGDELDASDIESLKDASKDLAMEMPIGALSPKAQGKISDALKGTAFELKDVKNKSLNDLSEELGDRASSLGKEIADDLKSNKPGVYYGLGVAGAAAVGVYGYKQGSGALEKLGIKPEFDKSFFDERVTAKAKGSWEAEMKNPNLSLNLNSKLKTSEHGRLAFGAKANVGGEDLKSIDFKGGAANLGYTHNLSNSSSLASNINANFDAGGRITSGRTDLKYSSDGVKLGLGANHGRDLDVLGYDIKGSFRLGARTNADTNLNFDRKFNFEKGTANLSHTFENQGRLNLNSSFTSQGVSDISAKYNYRRDDLEIGAGLKHDFLTDRTSANISAEYFIRDNFSVAAMGASDGAKDHRVGFGINFRF